MKKLILISLLSVSPLFAQDSLVTFTRLETLVLRANWKDIVIKAEQAPFAAKITIALADSVAKLSVHQAITVANAFEEKGWFSYADSFVVAYREYRESVKFKNGNRRFIEEHLPRFNEQAALSQSWKKIRDFIKRSAK